MKGVDPLVVWAIIWAAVCALALAGLISGCREVPPACAPEALGRIEAAYLADVVTKCKGFSYDACPVRAQLEETYAAKRAAWVACR